MLEEYASEIYGLLLPVLPENTERVVLRGTVTDSSYNIFYYARKKGEDQYHQCYDLAMSDPAEIDMRMLMNAFSLIFEMCKEARKDETFIQKQWQAFTMVLEGGRFSIDYDYDVQDDLTVPQTWKEKYLIPGPQTRTGPADSQIREKKRGIEKVYSQTLEEGKKYSYPYLVRMPDDTFRTIWFSYKTADLPNGTSLVRVDRIFTLADGQDEPEKINAVLDIPANQPGPCAKPLDEYCADLVRLSVSFSETEMNHLLQDCADKRLFNAYQGVRGYLREIYKTNQKRKEEFDRKRKNMTEKAAECLHITYELAEKNCRPVPELDAYYFWQGGRGGASVLINSSLEKLGGTSGIGFEKLKADFSKGKRS